jgi:hypothetical protein
MFQREETNGHGESLGVEALPGERLTGNAVEEPGIVGVQEGAAEAGTASGEAAEQAAADTAEAINEAYDTVDRESTA